VNLLKLRTSKTVTRVNCDTCFAPLPCGCPASLPDPGTGRLLTTTCVATGPRKAKSDLADPRQVLALQERVRELEAGQDERLAAFADEMTRQHADCEMKRETAEARVAELEAALASREALIRDITETCPHCPEDGPCSFCHGAGIIPRGSSQCGESEPRKGDGGMRWASTGPATVAQRRRIAKLGPFYVDWGDRLGSLCRVDNDEIVMLLTDEDDAKALMCVLNDLRRSKALIGVLKDLGRPPALGRRIKGK
jgi:hypothetical protein